MPKGIRKACANCIKARLACDEGRPCQRCVVHACECVAVPRKPRVKKQKLDMEPPPSPDKLNSDVVVPNWGHSEFAQGVFGAFQLDKTVQEESQFDGFAPNALLSSATAATRLSPLFLDTSTSFQLASPMMQMASPITSQIPSPPQLFTPPPSPAQVWTAAQTRQVQPAIAMQQLIPSQTSPLSSSAQLQTPQIQAQLTQPLQTPIQPQLVQQPIQPVHTQNVQIQQSLPQLAVQQPNPLMQQPFPLEEDIKPQLRQGFDISQMLSLLMDEKPTSLLSEWQGAQAGTYVDGQQMQAMNFYDPALFKKHLNPQLSALPQPMNATPLYPAPIAVFDKMKFQLLDANEAMAQFIGLTNVAEMAGKVTSVDDLIDSEAAQIAKQAYINFVTNPSPCFRLGEVRTQNGSSKTVEFHVDLTEQLLILTIKSVFDSSSKALPDVQYPQLMKTDMSLQQCKAFEFLSPID